MKYCPSCRERYPDDSGFCGDDGTPLLADESTAAADFRGAKYCSECGEALEPDGNFCPECGAPCGDRNDAIPSLPATEPLASSVRKESDEKNFTGQAEAAVKRLFPDAWIGGDVQVGFKEGRPLRTDLLVVHSAGILLIDCKDYPGRIRGAATYDYGKGELWTSQSRTGAIVEIKSGGRNPAQEALDKLSAFSDAVGGTRLRKEQSQIHAVLMFPDGADLSGIAGIPVSPDSLSSHPVAALTLAGLPSCKDKEAGPIDRQAVLRIIEALEVSKAGPKNARLDLKEKESPAGPPPNFSFAEEEPIRETAILTMPERAAGEEPRKGNGRLYLLGGTIGAGLVLLLLFAYFIPWPAPEPTLTGPVRKQDAPGSIPPPAPGGIEASPSDQSPGKAVSPAPAVGSGEDWPVPQTSDTTVATQTRSPAETGRQTEVASAKPQDSVANRDPKPAGEEKPLPKRNLPAPQESASKNAGSERPISRRPAEPGTYETIKPTAVRATPSDSAEIVDEINRGLRLNVSGSQGDWLIVHSRKRNRTVYVKRDDAMLIAEKSAKGADRELKWKEIELQIQQAISQRGVTGVTVSFIGDTAYLRGSVQTEKERFSAELAARTIPEVTHIHNGIWVGR